MPPTSDDLGPENGLDPRQIVLDGGPDDIEIDVGIPVRNSVACCPGDRPIVAKHSIAHLGTTGRE